MKLSHVPHRTTIEWIPCAEFLPPSSLEVLILTASGNVFEATHDGSRWMTADDGGTVWPVSFEVLAWADQDNLDHIMSPPPCDPGGFRAGPSGGPGASTQPEPRIPGARFEAAG